MRPLVGDQITLSATEFDVLWRAGHDEPLPAAIDVPSQGATAAERAMIVAQTRTALRDKGFLAPNGTQRHGIRRMLDTIAGRRVAIEVQAQLPHAFRAMLAVGARGAVIAAVVAGEVRLRLVPDTGIAATMASILPEAPAGPGRSVTIDASTFAELVRTDRASVLARSDLPDDDARVLLAAIEPVERIGQFSVPTGDRVVGFHDTPDGRYQVVRHITAVTDYLTITPATTSTLAAAIDELLREARS